MKTNTIILRVVLICAIAFALAYIGFVVFLSFRIDTLHAWQENILSNGPWSSQAVWMSEDRKVYLYCEKAPEAPLATVVASIATEEGSIVCTPEMPYGSKILNFCNEDGDVLFSCKVGLVGKEALKLYDMDNISDILAGSEIQTEEAICLMKSPYDTSLRPSTK